MAVKFVTVYVSLVAPVKFVHVELLEEVCHCMLPLYPESVSVIGVPEQNEVVDGETTGNEFTLTVIAVLGPSQPVVLFF